MRLVVGGDHAGYHLKGAVVAALRSWGHAVEDVGPHTPEPVDFPDVAWAVCAAVRDDRAERGLLVCGTGVGACIAANKVPGIRAALAHDTYSAQRARMSNDAQVLAMGARVIGPELAKAIAKEFLDSEFQGGRSQPKVDRIADFERELGTNSPSRP